MYETIKAVLYFIGILVAMFVIKYFFNRIENFFTRKYNERKENKKQI